MSTGIYCSTSVRVNDYVDVDVDLTNFPAEKLQEALVRVTNADFPALEDPVGVERDDLEQIHHLLLCGRQADAMERCRRMCSDALGRAL